MEITILQKNLKRGLNIVQNIIGKNLDDKDKTKD